MSKILQVCSYYAGTDIYKRLFDRLLEKKFSHDVLFFAASNSPIENIPDDFLVSRPYRRWERFLFGVKHAKVYRDSERTFDLAGYDIVHAHSLMSNGYIANRIYRQYNIPYIVAVRSTDLFTFFRYKPHLIGLGRRIMREASAVVFLSESYKRYTLEKVVGSRDRAALAAKSWVIPNGIDDQFLSYEETERSSATSTTLSVVQVSRNLASRNKNVMATIRACDLLVARGYAVSLTVVGRTGDGKIARELQRRAYATVVSSTDRGSIRHVLRDSTVFVMPSKKETFGLVYAEAMSQGVPVLYSINEGFDGQYPDGYVGFAVEPDNEAHISEKLLAVWCNRAELSRNALLESKRYDWNIIADEYVRLYRSVEGG